MAITFGSSANTIKFSMNYPTITTGSNYISGSYAKINFWASPPKKKEFRPGVDCVF